MAMDYYHACLSPKAKRKYLSLLRTACSLRAGSRYELSCLWSCSGLPITFIRFTIVRAALGGLPRENHFPCWASKLSALYLKPIFQLLSVLTLSVLACSQSDSPKQF